MNNLQNLMDEIRDWSDDAFGCGQRNPGILYHLKKEVPELIEALEKFQKENTIKNPYSDSNKLMKDLFFEFADVFMLILDSAIHAGLTANSLIYWTNKKLEINKKRKWGKPDENGVIEHIKD